MFEHDLAMQLFDIGAIRFGSFQLKSGVQSPIYLDLRLTISYPTILLALAEALYRPLPSLRFDRICGVPYTALPFASILSVRHILPMVMWRKEKKDHGTAQRIEGVFSPNQRCLIIEDVITSGTSIFETAKDLRQAGLIVEDAVVLVDRMQGGVQALEKQNIRVHPIFNLMQILNVLTQEHKIDKDAVDRINAFLQENQNSRIVSCSV